MFDDKLSDFDPKDSEINPLETSIVDTSLTNKENIIPNKKRKNDENIIPVLLKKVKEDLEETKEELPRQKNILEKHELQNFISSISNLELSTKVLTERLS